MGCRLSGALRRQQSEDPSRAPNWQRDVRFAPADVIELQTILWNMLVLEGKDRARSAADLRRLIDEVRASAAELGWAEPTTDELAGRLLLDTVEREEGGWDCHVVRKLETEEQVLALIFDDDGDGGGGGVPALKLVALEILLQWYVHTADCESMLRHIELSRAHAAGAFPRGGAAGSAGSSYMLQSVLTEDQPEEPAAEGGADAPPPAADGGDGGGDGAAADGEAPHDSLQSFVWRGSPDLNGKGSLARSPGAVCGTVDPRHSLCNFSRASRCGSLSRSATRGRGSMSAAPCRALSPPALPAPHASSLPVAVLAPSGARSPPPHAPSLSLSIPARRSAILATPCPPCPPADLAVAELRSEPPAPAPACLAASIVSRAPPYVCAGFAAACAAEHNQQYVDQLCFCLRGAMRTALRQYSTSHYDERGMQQRSAAQRVAGAEWSKDRHRAIARCGSLSALPSGGLLMPPEREYSLTVVLDLDETLVFARQGPLWVRPGVHEFLCALRDLDCEVVCWTASNRSYAGGILSRLDPMAQIVSQCIYSHPKWQRRAVGPQVKNLSLVGRDLDYTIIVDNLPDSVVGNELNAIVVENYEGCELHDSTLPTLAKVVQDLIESGLTVPDFLRDRSKSGSHLKYCEQRLVTQDSIWCFVLNSEPARFSVLV